MNPFLEFLFGLLSPAGGQVVNSATSLAVEQMEKQFMETGRDQKTEYEADGAGAMLSAISGYSSTKYEQYLERISKSSDSKTQSKTHPDYKSRISEIQKYSASSTKSDNKNPEFNLERLKKELP